MYPIEEQKTCKICGFSIVRRGTSPWHHLRGEAKCHTPEPREDPPSTAVDLVQAIEDLIETRCVLAGYNAEQAIAPRSLLDKLELRRRKLADILRERDTRQGVAVS